METFLRLRVGSTLNYGAYFNWMRLFQIYNVGQLS